MSVNSTAYNKQAIFTDHCSRGKFCEHYPVLKEFLETFE